MDGEDSLRDSAGKESADELPEEWRDTGRHPRLPDGDLGTCRTERGTVLYDRENPERYVRGTAVEVGEHA